MANENNLKPQSTRTKSEQREIATKGGKASGEARRQKKAAKEAAILFASMPALGENKELLKSLGIEKNELTNQMAMIVGLAKKAILGDAAACKLYLEVMGEAPVAELNLGANVQFNSGGLKETLEELKRRD